MTREPLRFTPPADGAPRPTPKSSVPVPRSPTPPPPGGATVGCTCPLCRHARQLAQGGNRVKTPEDGQPVHTPEQGADIQTRES